MSVDTSRFAQGIEYCSSVNLEQKDNLLRDSSKHQYKTWCKREATTRKSKTCVVCVINKGISEMRIC